MAPPPESNLVKALHFLQASYSGALLFFCVGVVSSAIKNNQTTSFENGIPTGLAACVVWGLIFVLATIEGGQGCLVGLQPIDKDSYKESHPIAYKGTVLAHKGDNMER